MAYVDIPNSANKWEYDNAASASLYSDSAAGANSVIASGIRTYTKPGTSDTVKSYIRTRRKGHINFHQYSEQLDNAYWGKARTAVTANQTISPDGTLNADLVNQDGANIQAGAIYRNNIADIAAGKMTHSVFAKYKTGSTVKHILLQDYQITTGSVVNKSWFNIETGTIGTKDAQHSNHTVEDYGNGWYRISYEVTKAAGGGGNFAMYLSDADNGSTVTLTNGVFLWGAQIQHDVRSRYFKTIGAASSTIETGEISKTYYDNQ